MNFKNKYTIMFIAILIFAIAIRAYFFFITQNQVPFWDELEFLNHAKHIVYNTPDTGWLEIRPIIFPLLLSAFYFWGIGIIGVKVLWLLISILGIFLVYLVGKKLFDEKVALIATAIYSVFYLDIFYAMRMLVDMPSAVISLFVVYCMLNRDKKIFALLMFPVLAFGILLKFNLAVMLPIIFSYLILTEGFSFMKLKKFWASIGLGFLVALPYFIYSFNKWGNPLYSFIGASVKAPRYESISSVFMQYITYFPNYIYTVFLVLFFIGAIILLKIFLIPELIRKEKELKSKLLIILWVIITFVGFGVLVNHFEDRYIITVFPAIFYTIGLGFRFIYSVIAKYSKIIAIIAVVGLLIFGGLPLAKYTDNVIKSKLTAYSGLKLAGEWIKENSYEKDNIISSAVPQITYYSERATYHYPENGSDFEETIGKYNPKFMVLSIWEKSPDWVYNYPLKYNNSIIPVQAWFQNKEQTQLDTVIYQILQ